MINPIAAIQTRRVGSCITSAIFSGSPTRTRTWILAVNSRPPCRLGHRGSKAAEKGFEPLSRGPGPRVLPLDDSAKASGWFGMSGAVSPPTPAYPVQPSPSVSAAPIWFSRASRSKPVDPRSVLHPSRSGQPESHRQHLPRRGSALLLSYARKKNRSGRKDLNLRPRRSGRRTLPGCATPRCPPVPPPGLEPGLPT